MQNQKMSLVLSSDAKPRLKWTPELHQRFVDAVNQIGGADKATPKSLMRVMGVPGLTLYHLKSHLQKYRLGKGQQPETSYNIKQEDSKEIENGDEHLSGDISNGSQRQITESLQITQAFQMQLEVQRKLQEQIKVQKHLQLRIEAQGKYLQSVLTKAQETLSGYGSSSAGVELAKAELSQLVSMVNNGCHSSPFSELTETELAGFREDERRQIRAICSVGSSFTSSESSGHEEEKQTMNGACDSQKSYAAVELPLMDFHPSNHQSHDASSNQAFGRRSGSAISGGNCVGLFGGKRLPTQKSESVSKLRKLRLLEAIDLNSQYHQSEI